MLLAMASLHQPHLYHMSMPLGGGACVVCSESEVKPSTRCIQHQTALKLRRDAVLPHAGADWQGALIKVAKARSCCCCSA